MRQLATESISSPIVQRALQVSQPGDRWEREADEMADEVMRMPDTGLSATRPWGVVQRCPDGSCANDDDGNELMRTVDASATAGPASIETLGPLGGSRPLSSLERTFFEPRFNRDFSRVRVHDTPESTQETRSLGALAFTVGPRIAVAAGAYRPGTRAGHRLLAHELTHVVQQGAVQRTKEEKE